MTSTARWGLKHQSGTRLDLLELVVGMTSPARSGLKQGNMVNRIAAILSRNDFHSPFGIETQQGDG